MSKFVGCFDLFESFGAFCDDLFVLRISKVRFDDGDHPRFENCCFIVFAVEAGIKGNGYILEREVETVSSLFELCDCARQQNRIMGVHTRRNTRDETVA